MTENTYQLIVMAFGLIVLLVLVLYAFITHKALSAATDTLKQFNANVQWKDAVEKGITETVPAKTVADIMAKFDTLANLMASMIPNPQAQAFIGEVKALADAVTDGQPNQPEAAPKPADG